MLAAPLYVERYMLAAAKGVLDEGRTPSWEDVAALPLCLLHQGMQNRRILDARLGERGLALRPVVTADSYVALFALVRQGRLCRSEEHTSELQSIMRISYAVFCLK